MQLWQKHRTQLSRKFIWSRRKVVKGRQRRVDRKGAGQWTVRRRLEYFKFAFAKRGKKQENWARNKN